MANPNVSPHRINRPAVVLSSHVPPEIDLPPALNAEALKDLHPLVPLLLDTIVKITSEWRTQTLKVAQLSAQLGLLHDEKSVFLDQIIGHGDQPKH